MNIVDHQILPLRDARQQFELAGVESSVHSFNSLTGLYYIGGKGGPCAMRVEEWMRYLAMCAQWAIAPQDLHDAPSISMLVVSSEEEAELAALRLRPNSDFARSFREIEECLLAHARCLSDDERDEIIRQITAKIIPLKDAVLRAEEIWLEDHAPVRVTVNGHQLSRLDEIIEPDTNEELHLTNQGGLLVATIKAEDHEAEWLLDEQGKFSTEGGAA